jgi:hypothetical protein
VGVAGRAARPGERSATAASSAAFARRRAIPGRGTRPRETPVNTDISSGSSQVSAFTGACRGGGLCPHGSWSWEFGVGARRYVCGRGCGCRTGRVRYRARDRAGAIPGAGAGAGAGLGGCDTGRGTGRVRYRAREHGCGCGCGGRGTGAGGLGWRVLCTRAESAASAVPSEGCGWGCNRRLARR